MNPKVTLVVGRSDCRCSDSNDGGLGLELGLRLGLGRGRWDFHNGLHRVNVDHNRRPPNNGRLSGCVSGGGRAGREGSGNGKGRELGDRLEVLADLGKRGRETP